MQRDRPQRVLEESVTAALRRDDGSGSVMM
jgi:hypothetical protein